MKRYTLHLFVLGLVSAWGLFSVMCPGVENRSAGLGVLGWLQLVFFLPGLTVMQSIKGALSNTDWLFVGAISWVALSALGVGLAHLAVSVWSAAQQAHAAAERRSGARG